MMAEKIISKDNIDLEKVSNAVSLINNTDDKIIVNTYFKYYDDKLKEYNKNFHILNGEIHDFCIPLNDIRKKIDELSLLEDAKSLIELGKLIRDTIRISNNIKLTHNIYSKVYKKVSPDNYNVDSFQSGNNALTKKIEKLNGDLLHINNILNSLNNKNTTS